MSVFGKTQKFINSKHVPSFKSPEFVRKRNVCKSPISSDEELNSPLVKLRLENKMVNWKVVIKNANEDELKWLQGKLSQEVQSKMIVLYGFNVGTIVENDNGNEVFLEDLGFTAFEDERMFKISNRMATKLNMELNVRLPKEVKKNWRDENTTSGNPTRRKRREKLPLSDISQDEMFENLPLSPIRIEPRGYQSNALDKRKRNHLRRLSRRTSFMSGKHNIFSGRQSVIQSHRQSVVTNILEINEDEQDTQWFLPEIVPLVLSRRFVSLEDLQNTKQVCVDWKNQTLRCLAMRASEYDSQPVANIYAEYFQNYSWGKFLSDGAYKEVFKVFNVKLDRLEAVSIMDIQCIEETGNEDIVRQEVYHSLLLSSLANICPNFLDIYGCKLHAFPPPKDSIWSGANDVSNTDVTQMEDLTTTGVYQYIQMELCDGGDVEEFMRNAQHELLPLDVVLPYFFQMCYSLYVGRDKFQLRHYDIKLLNFFMKAVPTFDEERKISYAFGESCYQMTLPSEYLYWIKLADYGTADTDMQTIDQPILAEHFTTLENAPIDFFFLGDAAIQNYAVDTFDLGLCMLHLFTGSAPYEEIVKDVHCPPDLMQVLKKCWKSKKGNQAYTVLWSMVQSDPENVLCDTLYRYLVLFGLPNGFEENKAVHAVRTLLNQSPKPNRRELRNVKSITASQQYQQDCHIYNLESGSNMYIARCRDRLSDFPNGMQLLLRMVSLATADRPTMKEILLSDLFDSIRTKPEFMEKSVQHFGAYGKLNNQELNNI